MLSAVFTTNRLFLRETTPADAAVMFQLNADPEVLRFTGDEPFTNVGEVTAFLSAYDDFKRNGMGRWAVVRKEDAEVLGWCGLKLHPNGMVDLGFRLFKKYWNQGYATEAALGCLHYGFETLGLNLIVGRVMPKNAASARVLQKAGMIFSHRELDEMGEVVEVFKINHEDYSRNKPLPAGG